MPNFIKISQTVAEIYGDLTVFKMAAINHFGFVKFEIFNGQSGQETHFASAYQIS